MSGQQAHTRVLRELGTAYALIAAIQSGLLTFLLESDVAVDDLAGATGLNPDGVARTLAVLQAAGWVERLEDGWVAAAWLRCAEDTGLGIRKSASVFEHLPTMLRDGSTMIPGEVRHNADAVRGLANMFGDIPDQLASALPAAKGTVLDVGAGSATWSLAMLQPDVVVVALDREEVLAAATARAASMGVSSQLTLLPGSFWALDLPASDRVVIANVVHLLNDQESRALVERAVASLKPGGDVVIVDVLGADEMSPEVAAYALHLRLREPHGTVHPVKRMQTWLVEAGLSDVRTVTVEAKMEIGAVVGRLS